MNFGLYIDDLFFKNIIIDVMKKSMLQTNTPFVDISFNKDKISKLNTSCAKPIKIIYISPKLFLEFFSNDDAIKYDDIKTKIIERKNIVSSPIELAYNHRNYKIYTDFLLLHHML